MSKFGTWFVPVRSRLRPPPPRQVGQVFTRKQTRVACVMSSRVLVDLRQTNPESITFRLERYIPVSITLNKNVTHSQVVLYAGGLRVRCPRVRRPDTGARGHVRGGGKPEGLVPGRNSHAAVHGMRGRPSATRQRRKA